MVHFQQPCVHAHTRSVSSENLGRGECGPYSCFTSWLYCAMHRDKPKPMVSTPTVGEKSSRKLVPDEGAHADNGCFCC